MKKIKELLVSRKLQLLELKKEKEKTLSNYPEGCLRVCHHANKTQYYYRNDPKNFNGVYIPKKKHHLAHLLAQKDYDQKIIRSAEKELAAIEAYFSLYPEVNIEEVYRHLHIGRQKIIVPIEDTDEEYVSKWENVEYEGKGFGDNMPEYFTAKGERVRSKSEVIIADVLNREKVPYRYEYPIYINGYGKVYPDFTVLNVKTRKEMYWEHLGMMDEPEYVDKFMKKYTSYVKDGFFPGENLILTYESAKNPLNQKMIMLMIKKYLK